MPKLLPTGRVADVWKRLPSGVFVPGTRMLPTGRELTDAQTLIQQCYLAANQKAMLWAVIGDLGVVQATVAGRCSRYNDYSGRSSDFIAPSAAAEPVVLADATLGGKTYLQGNGARGVINPIDLPTPSTQKCFRKIVNRLDAFPPGSRQWGNAGTNRFGVITRSSPDTILLDNGTLGGTVDQPEDRWGVMTWRLGNSTADFLRWGPSANAATGVNCGNSNPSAGIGKFFTNAGTTGVEGSEALDFAWSVDLTTAEEEAVEDLIVAYYGSSNLISRTSTGNLKLALVGFCGSSQTRDQPPDYNGMRFDFWDTYGNPSGLNYPTYASGSTSNGAWPQPQHSGVSGLGINVDAGGANPDAALENVQGTMIPGGGAPVPGVGEFDLLTVEYGGADILAGAFVPGGVGVPGSTTYGLLQVCIALANGNPNARLVINNIVPQQGNPATIGVMCAEIGGVGGLWDAYDALYPARTCLRVDVNTAINGGVWTAALFVDNVHLNKAGQDLWFGAMQTAGLAALMSTLTTY